MGKFSPASPSSLRRAQCLSEESLAVVRRLVLTTDADDRGVVHREGTNKCIAVFDVKDPVRPHGVVRADDRDVLGVSGDKESVLHGVSLSYRSRTPTTFVMRPRMIAVMAAFTM
jgi:hypothetical protein